MSGIYILDHAVYKPDPELKVVAEEVERAGKEWPVSHRAGDDHCRGGFSMTHQPPLPPDSAALMVSQHLRSPL
jgi:hypothetical protein